MTLAEIPKPETPNPIPDADLLAAVRAAVERIDGPFTERTVARQVLHKTDRGDGNAPKSLLAQVGPVLEQMCAAGEIVFARAPDGRMRRLYRRRPPCSPQVPQAHCSPQVRGRGSKPGQYGQEAWFLDRVRAAAAALLAEPGRGRLLRTRDLVALLEKSWDRQEASPEAFHRAVAQRVRLMVDKGELRVVRAAYGPHGCVYTGAGKEFADVTAPQHELLPADSPMRPEVPAAANAAAGDGAGAGASAKKRISPERAERLRLLEHKRRREAALEAERAGAVEQGSGESGVGSGEREHETRPRQRAAADVLPINPMRLSASDAPSPIDVSGLAEHVDGRSMRAVPKPRSGGKPFHRGYHRGAMVKPRAGKDPRKPGGRFEKTAEVEALFDAEDDE